MRALALVASLALLAPSPLQAQSQDTPADDLICAAWAAVAISMNEDQEIRSSLSMALVWFLGRYEVATGVPFERALTADYINANADKIIEAEPNCQARLRGMAQRMTDHGTALQRSDD